jgi:hypothetical protein
LSETSHVPQPASATGEPIEALVDNWTEDLEQLPPRPRWRLLTPLTVALFAVLLVSGGFIAGALVEKGQAGNSPSGAAGAPRGAAGGFAAGGFGRGAAAGRGGTSADGQGAAAATVGQVSVMHGRTLYVTTPQGNTVEVRIPAGETVTKTVDTSVRSIHPGETVVVQGPQGKNGSITARSVRASGASAGGGGVIGQLFSGGGGFGGGRGAATGGSGGGGGP